MEGRFLIGPMAKLGWGTPTLVSLELGLLLELPRPAFAILGVLRVALPAEEFAIVYLQVNFAGSVDFEKGQLQFDASLYNSRVLTFPLTGDMAVRHLLEGQSELPADRRRVPSGLHAAADEHRPAQRASAS